MSNSPLLSIIIPVYNVEEYLEKCINSILHQSFYDFELILVNDGSSDRSLNICQKYESIDSRIVLINQNNKGQAAARNTGLDVSKGKYIHFVDSDDYLSPDFYLNNIAILENNCDIDVVNVNMIIVYDENRKENYIVPNKKLGSVVYAKKELYSIWSYGGEGVIGFVYLNIFRSNCLKKIRFKEGMLFEDCLFMGQVLNYVSKIYFSQDGLYYYVQRNGSTLHSAKTKQKCIGDCEATLYFIDMMIKYGVSKDLITKSCGLLLGRMTDNSYIFGYEIFKNYFSCISKLNISIYDILKSEISTKRKLKFILIRLFGAKLYLNVTKKTINKDFARRRRI